MTGLQLLEGVVGKEGVTFLRGQEWARVQFLHKK